ncbi:hypothetical protein BIBE0010001c01_00033 [Bifidobacterium phage BigBern1]|nr:hypothetical protein BIBE0010001c01_00033 [Bifidobacterium phage BigBern1]
MAQYGITYRCGHEDTVQIYGTNVHGEREKKAAWYGSIDCPACRAAKARQEHDGLPALEGTDRQVAWADDIRDEVLDEARNDRDGWADHGAAEEQIAAADRIIAWLKGQTSASWWIDHQYAIDAVNAAQQTLSKQEA